ncbi:hypothetical protein V6N13_072079 [Hibiscus sabdariffa]
MADHIMRMHHLYFLNTDTTRPLPHIISIVSSTRSKQSVSMRIRSRSKLLSSVVATSTLTNFPHNRAIELNVPSDHKCIGKPTTDNHTLRFSIYKSGCHASTLTNHRSRFGLSRTKSRSSSLTNIKRNTAPAIRIIEQPKKLACLTSATRLAPRREPLHHATA